MSESIAPFFEKYQRGEFVRLVGFGSSNTQRRVPGMHWLDCVELACRQKHGAGISCINSGRGGDTTALLLERMERDCLSLKPDLAILTVGGNDSFAARGITPEAFLQNLKEIIGKLRQVGAVPVLQTYYAFDAERLEPNDATALFATMDRIRAVAAEESAFLIDHHARWEPMRKRFPEVYRGLLTDPMHVNETGNLLLGLDIVRAFGLELEDHPTYREARALQALLDALA